MLEKVELSFDKKAPCVGNSFKKENSLNVSCSCCRNTNDNLHLQDLPICLLQAVSTKLTAVGNKNFDSSILQFQKIQGMLQTNSRPMCNYANRLQPVFFS